MIGYSLPSCVGPTRLMRQRPLDHSTAEEIISPKKGSTSQKRRISIDSDDSPRPSKSQKTRNDDNELYVDLLEGLVRVLSSHRTARMI